MHEFTSVVQINMNERYVYEMVLSLQYKAGTLFPTFFGYRVRYYKQISKIKTVLSKCSAKMSFLFHIVCSQISC